MIHSRRSHPPRRAVSVLLLATALAYTLIGTTQAADVPVGATILNDLRNFRTMGTVLYIAAHPDDENTQFIAYMARSRHYRTGYLSLTRGDGGQNLLGPEFGSELGVIRTQELLAARQVDGGVQFFSRALDFGFSKDYQQTLTKWDRQDVVADMVRVIRRFRPDVVVTRFSPEPSTTHGHHTASAVLAIEAFKLAGDPSAFADQGLLPWQAKRLFWNVTNFANAPATETPGDVHVDIGHTDDMTGKSFSALAGESRAMHKSQGFGNIGNLGDGGARIETFHLLAGVPATSDIMDGIDTTWARIRGGDDIGRTADGVISHFNAQNPVASLPALLKLRATLSSWTSRDPIVFEKSRLLDHIIAECIGLEVHTSVTPAEAVPGESVTLHQSAVVTSDVHVRWLSTTDTQHQNILGPPADLVAGQALQRSKSVVLPLSSPVSQPYWLRHESTAGMFLVDDLTLVGRPENPPTLPLSYGFEINGQPIFIQGQAGDAERPLRVIPPVSLAFGSDVQLFTPSSQHVVHVTVTPSRTTTGRLSLDAPAGWSVTPKSVPFSLTTRPGTIDFTVTAPSRIDSVNLSARAIVGGVSYSYERIDIRYPHIPPQLLQPPARVKAVCLDLKISGHKVGYLPGAGDSVSASLEQMGYQVVPLTGTDLTAAGLHDLDAVVIGVRAFNVRTDLAANLPALFQYVQDGGTVVEQYNTPRGLLTPQLAPYPISLSDNLPTHRVTNEKAPVTLLTPDHPAFNMPNKIVAADFDGWVQERGLNFPDQWDKEHFTSLLACSDTGEAPLTSGLLVARYGKGYYVYTGLSFFRQLPAGVAGAYRLFANLVSLGR